MVRTPPSLNSSILTISLAIWVELNISQMEFICSPALGAVAKDIRVLSLGGQECQSGTCGRSTSALSMK